MTFNYLDWFFVAAVVLSIVFAALRGFVKSISGVVRVLGAFLIAKILGPLLGKLIASHLIGPKVYSGITDKISEMFAGVEGKLSYETLVSENPEFAALLNRFDAGESFSALLEQQGASLESSSEALTEMVISSATPWVERISLVIAYVIVFVVAFLLLLLTMKLIEKLTKKINVLKRTDHILGAVLGIVEGVYFVVGVAFVLELFLGILSSSGLVIDELRTTVDQSMLFGWFYRLALKLL